MQINADAWSGTKHECFSTGQISIVLATPNCICSMQPNLLARERPIEYQLVESLVLMASHCHEVSLERTWCCDRSHWGHVRSAGRAGVS